VLAVMDERLFLAPFCHRGGFVYEDEKCWLLIETEESFVTCVLEFRGCG